MADLAGSTGAAHIACCFDRNMELSFLVLASSLKRHLKSDREVVLHAFHCDPLAHDPVYFTSLNSKSFTLRLRQIENGFRGQASWPGYLTAATLLRLHLPSLLKDIDRVVYLDCDLIVLDDITTLHDTDLSGLPLAACLDFWLTGPPPFAPPGWDAGDWHRFLRETVGLDDCQAYFNAGVMVMDLARFRRAGLIGAAEQFLQQRDYQTAFVDQDALNHVINGAFVRLDSRWNVLGNRGETTGNAAGDDAASPAAPHESYPWILHYAGPYKPWNCEGRRATPWNARFWQEAAASPVLPQLVRAYLESCARRGLTKLRSADVLLSSGKPRLRRHDLLVHAERYRTFPGSAKASESIARDLDGSREKTDPGTALLPVERVSHCGGIRDGEMLIFDLEAADGHVVFGPYLWYPFGRYQATFILATKGIAPDAPGKFTIDIVDDTGQSLAQRDLPPSPSAAASTLQVLVDRNEMFLAFRIFAGGFAEGELRFGGVRLRSCAPH